MRYTREEACSVWLACGEIDPGHLRMLLQTYGSAESVYDAFITGQTELIEEFVGSAPLKRLGAFAAKDKLHEILSVMKKHDISLLSSYSADYPVLLKEIEDYPVFLFYQGDLGCLNNRCLAIVGSRRASPKIRTITENFARELSAHGVSVVSGLAAGVDTAAHKGCIAGGSPTIALMACGLDQNYPAFNRNLRKEIIRNHGIIMSEYAPGSEPLPHHFPIRNRIISGLCRGTLIMECGIRSGTMLTADHALNQGREVFVYPGTVGSENSEGNTKLLQDGAYYVTQAAHVIHALNWDDSQHDTHAEESAETIAVLSSPEEKKIYTALKDGELSFDELIAATDLSAPALMAALSQMDLFGYIKCLPGKTYMRV